ncbi:MAG TPA: CAP domain-containing protein [Candidatus Paceibacterota bacterium]|nr:CAP domain-containing protein [Candidatus Paceibacterota bacterium]HPT17878.1 CAP domain-containing protein [Candidatus Paceibacterota bacterium]
MISWLRKYFIPHEENSHRPHFLRNYNIRMILVIILFLEIFSFLIPTLNYVSRFASENMAAVLPGVLSSLTNEERQAEKLPTLATNDLLTKAAEMKAQDMATNGYFAHTSPDGKSPWYWFHQVEYNYKYAGENLAINFTDSKDVTNAWMASPTHRENIMKGKYTEIGTGIATGIFEGRQTIFVAQLYGSQIEEKPIVKNEEQNTIVKKEKPVVTETKTFPKVLGTETTEEENTKLATEVKEETVKSVVTEEEPTFMQKLLTSPHNTTNIILIVVFGIVLLSLLLNIFIKIKHHHPDLVTNGLLILVIIGAFFVANNFLSKNRMVILDTFNFSSEQQ